MHTPHKERVRLESLTSNFNALTTILSCRTYEKSPSKMIYVGEGNDKLEKEMATQFSFLAWRIPWTEEPSSLQSMGSQDWDMT